MSILATFKLFLRLCVCAPVGEITVKIIKIHGMYVKKRKKKGVPFCCNIPSTL